MINNQQISFIDSFILKRITKSELIELIGKRYSFEEYDALLSNALIKDKNVFSNQLFNKIFWHLPVSLSRQEKDYIYKKYISTHFGHFEHENMLDYFHNNIIDPNKNVSILDSLVKRTPKYFKLDDSEPIFLQKCLFAISKQPSLNSRLVLEYYTKSKNQTISTVSKKYLERI